MSSPINKETLEYLAKLARIKLDPEEEPKLLKDLTNILEHFRELQGIDTENVKPFAGGTDLKNVFREDGSRENTDQGTGKESFPESKDGFLKIPPVFPAEGGSASGGE